MAKQSLNQKKVQALRTKTGLPVLNAKVRGGTDHTITLLVEGGDCYSLLKDGSIHKTIYKWQDTKTTI